MPAILQVVSGVGSTTSLVDLNDNPTGIMVSDRNGLALATTEAGSGALTWSASGAGTELTSRTITVPVTLFGTTSDALGTKVATLVKAVDQPWTLRIRRSGATVDSWLRCFPTVPQLTTNITDSHRVNTVTGTITAATEPYAYGARVDIGSTTVAQNPATGGAMYLDITNVGGDSPTPAVIRCTDTTITGAAHGTLVAVRYSGTPTNLTGLVAQAESGTGTQVGSNVTVTNPLVDASFSNGNGIRFAFAAAYTSGAPAVNYGQITVTPSLSGTEAPGVYKVLARVRRSDTGSYTLTMTVAGSYVLDPVTMSASGTNTRLLDLGLVQLPAGQPQALAAPTNITTGAAAPSLVVTITRPDGAALTNFDIDYLYLVPADEDLGVVYQDNALTAGWYITLDGYQQDAFISNGDPFNAATNMASPTTKLDFVGGVPRLYPGTNRLFVITGLSPTGTGTAPTTANPAVLVSYWPRYSWLA